MCADKSQIQPKWGRKHGLPPSAHVSQNLPFLFVIDSALAETKYFKEDIFWKYIDCNLAHAVMVGTHQRDLQQNVPL